MASKMEDKSSKLYKMRHSAAHVLAQAVLEMFPEAKLGVGPAIDNGFYYDFDLPRTLIPEDLPILEKKMKQIVKQRQKFRGREVDSNLAIEMLEQAKQDYKVELVKDFAEKGDKITFYENFIPQKPDEATFVDLCEGGHVENTGEIGAFKLDKISSCYWKGDENNPSMQRIYGLLFENREDLDAYLKQLEEAKKRDHRKLGQELDLFSFSELVGSGLPLFSPKGALLREELNNFSQELRLEQGFQKVWIPHITKNDLYKKSGHWDKFGDELFLVTSQETSDELVMKPMNCPHHQQIFDSKPRSYKDLPIKYLETTTVYRDEKSGELLGLSRVRSITQDDSHIFCTPDQITEVYQMLIDIIKKFYDSLGMKYKARLSFRDPNEPEKYLGKPELWEKAESILMDIAKKNDLDYFVAEGEAAFYGPKIDFMIFDAIGREWQLATPQLDFVQPQRFNLKYIDQDGQEKVPVMIHFALLGSLERFLSVYIEHTAGAFPTWVAPVQVRILPVNKVHHDYADEVAKELTKAGVRFELDYSDDSLGKKIRNSEKMKIPYMLVIGDKEVDSRSVAARNYHTKEQETHKLEDFLKDLTQEIQERRLPNS